MKHEELLLMKLHLEGILSTVNTSLDTLPQIDPVMLVDGSVDLEQCNEADDLEIVKTYWQQASAEDRPRLRMIMRNLGLVAAEMKAAEAAEYAARWYESYNWSA